MNKNFTNIIVILGIVLAVFAAYYVFTQDGSFVLSSGEQNTELEQLVLAAERFAQHQQIINDIDLDVAFLESTAFTRLQDFTPDPDEFEIGRPDPFLPTRFNQSVRAVTTPVVTTPAVTTGTSTATQ